MHPNGMLTHFWGSKFSKTDGLKGGIHVYKHTEEGFFLHKSGIMCNDFTYMVGKMCMKTNDIM